MGSQRVGHDSATNIHVFIPAISPIAEVPAPRLNCRIRRPALTSRAFCLEGCEREREVSGLAGKLFLRLVSWDGPRCGFPF